MTLVVSGLVDGVGGEVRLRFMMMSGECGGGGWYPSFKPRRLGKRGIAGDGV